MWNDRIIEAIRQCPHDSLKLPEPLATEVDQLDLSSLERRREAIGRLLPKLKYMDSGERVRCADAVVAAAGALVPRDLMMSSAQLVKLALDGMLVGGHTVNHPILAALPDAQAHQEIAFGKRALESLLQRPVDSFAYPNGKPGVDYTARDMALVRDAGYRNAVSTSWGVAGADADLWQLPRFTPWDRTQVRFGLRLALNLRNKVVLCDPMPPGPVLDRPSDDQALRRGFPEAGD